MKMGLPLEKREQHFTYGDYRQWPDDERWELINGVAYNMCAAPNRDHQRISGELGNQLHNWLKGKPCRVYAAPFDVLVPKWTDQADDEVDTVVQPDLVVYCDRTRLTPAGARGAPDLAVEILSPWTSKKDQNEKFRLYEQNGVREYWVIDGGNKWLQIYRLQDGRYGVPETFLGGGQAASVVLESFVCPVDTLFVDD